MPKPKSIAKTKPKEKKSPCRALVLPGGGGRGAYQIGVARALFEKGITFDYAFGTSIGAINATLLAQGSLERLIELWSAARLMDLFHLPLPAQLAGMVFGTKLGILDPTPMEKRIRQEVDFEKLKASSMKVGFFTTDLCSLKTRMITIDDIESKDELIEVLMASSAIPMVFPPRPLDGEGMWIDGGLVRNTPMEASIDLGAEEIYVVLLHPESINTCPTSMFGVFSRCLDIMLDASANRELQAIHYFNELIKKDPSHPKKPVAIHIFQPHQPVNLNLLEINPAVSQQLMQAGYEDAKKQLENDVTVSL
jgi:NTE family protein